MVTTPQLNFVGLSGDAITHRVRRRTLHRVHRGVYLVGAPPPTNNGRVAAAVLAVGPGSASSHRAGAQLLELLPFDVGPIHVTTAGGHRRHRPGIRVHQVAIFDQRDLTRRELIPVTSVARTILDVAEAGDLRELERMINTARLMKKIQPSHLAELRERTFGMRGWALVDVVLRAEGADGFSRSQAERAMRRLVSKAGLPMPRRNVRHLGHELDFFWPDLGLNVEIDGWQWHSPGFRENADRDRDTFLAANGVQVMRFSRDQLKFTPQIVVARLAAAIALASQRQAPTARR